MLRFTMSTNDTQQIMQGMFSTSVTACEKKLIQATAQSFECILVLESRMSPLAHFAVTAKRSIAATQANGKVCLSRPGYFMMIMELSR